MWRHQSTTPQSKVSELRKTLEKIKTAKNLTVSVHTKAEGRKMATDSVPY